MQEAVVEEIDEQEADVSDRGQAEENEESNDDPEPEEDAEEASAEDGKYSILFFKDIRCYSLAKFSNDYSLVCRYAYRPFFCSLLKIFYDKVLSMIKKEFFWFAHLCCLLLICLLSTRFISQTKSLNVKLCQCVIIVVHLWSIPVLSC